MAKNSKKAVVAAPVAPLFSTVAFFDAGFQAGTNDAHEQVIIAAVADDKLEEAKNAYVEGYVVGGLWHAHKLANPGDKAETPGADLLAHARTVMAGCNPEANPKAGQHKRTKKEHDLHRAGTRRFNRMRAKLNVPPVSNRGGDNRDKNKAPESVTVKIGKIESAPEMVQPVNLIKERWLALVSASKGIDLPADLSALKADITAKLNRFELELDKLNKK